MNLLKKIAIALTMGAKNVNDEMFTSYSSPVSKHITQEQSSHVLQDILDDKLTKQVQEFRYRHYMVLRETSKKMRAKERREIHNLVVDPYDNQYQPEMGIIIKNTVAGIYEDKVERKYTNVLFENKQQQVPIEKYVNKLVVRNINGSHKLLEIYFNKNQVEHGASGFVLDELTRMVGNPMITPLTNISRICFVTQSVIGNVDDFLYFEYKILSLYKVVEWNGNIILKYIAEPTINGEDILRTEYYDSTEDMKITSSKAFSPTTNSHNIMADKPKQRSYEELLEENERLKNQNKMLRNFR